MKKHLLTILPLAALLLLTLTACGSTPAAAKNFEIDTAIQELTAHWEIFYSTPDVDYDYLEIRNTRVVTIKDTAAQVTNSDLFENVDYVVEFLSFVDYYGAAPYYQNTDDTVVFYEDGSCQLLGDSIFKLYSSATFAFDYSDIIDQVHDFGSAFNGVLIPN